MPVPPYTEFIEPILRHLAANAEAQPARAVHRAAADALGLSAEDRAELLPSGNQEAYKNRAGWAHDRLKRAGLSSSPRRGFWRITEKGIAFVEQYRDPLSTAEIESIAGANLTLQLSNRNRAAQPVADPDPSPVEAVATPDERLESALQEIRAAVAADILEALATVSPTYFERVVLEVLHRMGYGASKEDLQRVGGSGDGGIDGVISLDKLGLEKVYVQAKRWQNPVGPSIVREFYGALAGLRARKGVIITTSTFTAQAIDFARKAEGIVLVDGNRLAQLMIEHGVGVSLRPIQVPHLDGDFFEEG
ncbi:restriction endonuclease [bacterium]|nr:restriction endonuclease [bacterium]